MMILKLKVILKMMILLMIKILLLLFNKFKLLITLIELDRWLIHQSLLFGMIKVKSILWI